MEEKNVTFNFLIVDSDDEDKKAISISSDIDDDIEYLDIDEKLCLITELLIQCGRQLILEKYPEEDTEEYDENDEEQQEVLSNLRDLMEAVVYSSVNTLHNIGRAKFNLEPERVEYSMVSYKTLYQKAGDYFRRPLRTYHSIDVDVGDPLIAGAELINDSISAMLSEGMPKKEVKKLITTSLSLLIMDCNNYIDSFEEKE